ncbi:MAG: hypothetical protein JW818_00170 [Pirellulales bacterium]|nr:hypothetical protein [Pirellulales bacterium]
MNTIRFFVTSGAILFITTFSFASDTATKSHVEKPLVIASPTVAPTVGMDAMARGLPYLKEFVEYYFPSRCGAKPEVTDVDTALNRPGPKLLLCSKQTAQRIGAALPERIVEHDGFYLVSSKDKQGAPVVHCVGNNASGIKYALYRLIHECEYADRTLSLPRPLRLAVSPLLENRLTIQALSWKVLDPEANAKYYWNFWPDEKVDAMVRMNDFFGFNGVEKSLMSFPAKVGRDVSPETTERLSIRLLDEQRRIGGKAVAFLWGAALWEDRTMRQRICLSSEKDGRRMRREYRAMAQKLGKHIDAFVTHWADPGGCDGEHCACTVRTPQEAHMELLDLMRRENPEVQSFFSVWNIEPTAGVPPARRGYWRWANTKSIHDILDSGILSKDVGVWVGDPNGFSAERCRAVAASGRPLGIWMWYLADNEIRPCLHVHWKQVARYFRELPKTDYGRHIAWHQIEINRHGDWNTLGLAVGGPLMIDPDADPRPYALEFCASIVGPANAETMLDILDAVGDTRCRYHRNRQGRRFHDHAGWGSPDPRADIARARAALDKLDRMKLPAGHIPKIPYVEKIYNPEILLADLRKHLENIILHNEARLKLLAAISFDIIKSFPEREQKAYIKKLGRQLAPTFHTKGIGTCPEEYLWTRLLSQKGEIPDTSTAAELEGR